MIQTVTIALDNATAAATVDLAGDTVRVIDASSSTAEINLSPDTAPAMVLPARLQDGFTGQTFRRLRASWTAQPGAWVTLAAWGDFATFVRNPELLMSGD
mgnify:CR=1 FL=1